MQQQTFTVKQVADEFSVSPGWLRLGERLGALPCARRRANGWRYYTQGDIEELRRIGVGERKRRLADCDE